VLHRWRVVLGAVCVVGGLVAPTFGADPAHGRTSVRTVAAPAGDGGFNGIDVVQVQGLLDPPNASLVRDALHDAEARKSTALVLQLDSSGAVSTDARALARTLQGAHVPVVVWVGPAGSSASGGSLLLAESAPLLYLATNAEVGPLFPLRLDESDHDIERAALPVAPSRADALAAVETRALRADAAVKAGVADGIRAVIGDVIIGLDGQTVSTVDGPVKLSTAEVTKVDGKPRRRPNQDVRFRKLSLVGQLQHTLGTPWAAYFLFAVGGSLVVFEFFTISIGIAGVVGALCLAGACFGFSHLPVNGWAIGLLVLAFLGYSIDIQAGGLGPWTVIGTLSLVGGSLGLFGGDDALSVAWWVVLLVCLGVVTFMLGGMTAMLRSRFATPTIGREGMIGELGTAATDIDPDGTAIFRDAQWKARTNRATPVKRGDVVRVVAVEGLVLEIEPEAGGAKDYRDRARSREH
jgi:membrane-bound serine protease (ClpP class)